MYNFVCCLMIMFWYYLLKSFVYTKRVLNVWHTLQCRDENYSLLITNKKEEKKNNNVWNFIAPLRKSFNNFFMQDQWLGFHSVRFWFCFSPIDNIKFWFFFVSLLPSICMRKEEEGNQEKIDTTSIVICTWFSVKCCQQMVPRIFFFFSLFS